MEAEIARAREALTRGGLVAFPTETVYGLGADAQNDAAVRRVYELKGRPDDHPLIVHLADRQWLEQWAVDFDERASELARTFWPGPLTLVVKRHPRISLRATGGLDTVALRVPRHPVALALLKAFGGGIAAPSANRFQRVSPTTAEHVRSEFDSGVDVILDGGPCEVGLESTIVDVSGPSTALLRHGGVPQEAIESCLRTTLPAELGRTRAPGQHDVHYAPRARVVLAHPGELEKKALELGSRRVVVLRRVDEPYADVPGVASWTWPPSLEEYAHTLYATLRAVDDEGFEVAIVSLPEDRGLGRAIADRLRKAAASAS